MARVALAFDSASASGYFFAVRYRKWDGSAMYWCWCSAESLQKWRNKWLELAPKSDLHVGITFMVLMKNYLYPVNNFIWSWLFYIVELNIVFWNKAEHQVLAVLFLWVELSLVGWKFIGQIGTEIGCVSTEEEENTRMKYCETLMFFPLPLFKVIQVKLWKSITYRWIISSKYFFSSKYWIP